MRSEADGAPSFVHLPGLRAAGGEFGIAGDEAHYLRRVVRVRAGERVTASDGEGTLAELRVVTLDPELRVERSALRQVERRGRLEVWCGAPEGDRADWLVEKLAELGVATLRPVDGERGGWERLTRRTERWERLATAALRQSRSAYRLVIAPPARLDETMAAAGVLDAAYLADVAGSRFAAPPSTGLLRVAAAIGPSSGFSAGEIKQLVDKGFVPTRLAASRLRTETAAVAMAAVVAAALPALLEVAGP
ncbi:MAG: RsmE family RNA methyltransferase [Candidatus Eisenbacteria bacterium]|nr:RsmE family RNA methyltransferase [Candidatus Eisenbacteria bacterium]